MRIADWSGAKIGETVTLSRRYSDGSEFAVRGRLVGIDDRTDRTAQMLADGSLFYEPITKVRLLLDLNGDSVPAQIEVDVPSNFEVDS